MQTIEVFKTNITCPEKAKRLVILINKKFAGCNANFDLDDCDNVLRIVSSKDCITASHFIDWLKNYECCADILPEN